VLHIGADLTASFVGKVTTDDTTNGSDNNGTRDYASIGAVDWVSFDSFFRAWGEAGSAFPSTDNRGPCTSGTCQIWDWRLSASDTVSREFNGPFQEPTCPASADGSVVITDQQTVPNVFLGNAREIIFDRVGDDDGLCEAAEACLYSPNLGAYQGEPDLGGPVCTTSIGATLY